MIRRSPVNVSIGKRRTHRIYLRIDQYITVPLTAYLAWKRRSWMILMARSDWVELDQIRSDQISPDRIKQPPSHPLHPGSVVALTPEIVTLDS